MMEDEKEVGTFEAKNRLSALVEEAALGKRIWITRRGRRMALLSSGISPAPGGKSVVDDFRKLRAKTESGPESIRELIEEGRR